MAVGMKGIEAAQVQVGHTERPLLVGIGVVAGAGTVPQAAAVHIEVKAGGFLQRTLPDHAGGHFRAVEVARAVLLEKRNGAVEFSVGKLLPDQSMIGRAVKQTFGLDVRLKHLLNKRQTRNQPLELREGVPDVGGVAVGGVYGKGIEAVVVFLIHRKRQTGLPEIGKTGGLSGLFAGIGENRKKQGRQNRNNGDDNEQFDQGKAWISRDTAGGTGLHGTSWGRPQKRKVRKVKEMTCRERSSVGQKSPLSETAEALHRRHVRVRRLKGGRVSRKAKKNEFRSTFAKRPWGGLPSSESPPKAKGNTMRLSPKPAHPPRTPSVLLVSLACVPLVYSLSLRLWEVKQRPSPLETEAQSKARYWREAHTEELIFRAAAQGNEPRVKALLQTPDGRTALQDPRDYWYEQVAFRPQAVQMMKTFWNCGVPPKPGELSSTLLRTVRENQEEASLWLIEKGARIEKPFERNVLRGACYFGKEKLASALIRAGAEVNLKSFLPIRREKDEPLIRPSRYGFSLRREEPRERPEAGWTVLMTAAERKHLGILKILLEAGAEVNARTERNTTALKLAQAAHWKEGETLLKTYGSHL